MRRLALFLSLFILPVVTVGSVPAAHAATTVTMGRYIVVLKPTANVDAMVAQETKLGATVTNAYYTALKGFAITMPTDWVPLLRADSRVSYVVADQPARLTAQVLPTGINRIDGELSSTHSGDGTGSVNVNVAVIDTGIDVTHPDLNVVGGYNCAATSTASYSDSFGHGTHVAGIIGAKDNQIGVVGVAPGTRLWSFRAAGGLGDGSVATALCSVDRVTSTRTDSDPTNDIQVANMSLGFSPFGNGSADDGNCGRTNRDPMHTAICASVAAGVTYVVAAGNASTDAANFIPAAYDEVITVSALADFDGKPGGLAAPTCRADEDDTFANFSNFGADVDLIAPGVCIYSTASSKGQLADSSGYRLLSGTSMAAPHVAGAAALYKSTHPTATPAQVKAALIANGTLDWDTSTDPDGVPDPLLNVSSF
jgi:subtilisin